MGNITLCHEHHAAHELGVQWAGCRHCNGQNKHTNISKVVTGALSKINNLIILSTLSEYGDMYIQFDSLKCTGQETGSSKECHWRY